MWNDLLGPFNAGFNAGMFWRKHEKTASEEHMRRQENIKDYQRAMDSIRSSPTPGDHVNRTRQGRELVEKILDRTAAELEKHATMPSVEVRITRSQACLLYDYCPAVRGFGGLGYGDLPFTHSFLTLDEKVSRVDGGTLDGARLVVVPDPVVIDMTKE